MPNKIGNSGGMFHPISKADIELAQKHTKSNTEAARFLGVGYPRYRKYAKIYNLFDSHANPRGFGTPKGFGAQPSKIKLKDIFANKHKGYSIIRLKHRLIARNLIPEQCDLCGFKERRITDNKAPLMLTFRNGQRDFAFDNLQLLCYNCTFLTSGAPSVANRNQIQTSFIDPDKIAKKWQMDPKPRDQYELDDPPASEETPSEFDDIKEEILRELGRE
jgi:hypothetical protein